MFMEAYRKSEHVFENEDDAMLCFLESDYINKYDKCKEINIENINEIIKKYIKQKVELLLSK